MTTGNSGPFQGIKTTCFTRGGSRPRFAAVKFRSAFELRPEGRGSEHGWGLPDGAAQAGFTEGADYGLYFRRAKHGESGDVERSVPMRRESGL